MAAKSQNGNGIHSAPLSVFHFEGKSYSMDSLVQRGLRMWEKKESNAVQEVKPVSSTPMGRTSEHERSPARSSQAHIGKSVMIKGDITGGEDLYVDGEF